ncbi:hypothetical protein [Duncaniella muris]|uniref:hypothetical protein n=1 Tax=Duncaniella muris TaxID=2094150 RepID=UPI001434B41C|nr:hypothetical protein [Duncaniella muris]GFI53086.1 hypothetical protein IMSAGC021_01396 [Muribaculaceae bacterium]
MYNLRYYARRLGYRFSKKERSVTVPERNRRHKIESKLQAYGYGIQLNIFGDE